MNSTDLQKYVQEHPVCPSLDAWLSQHLTADHQQLYATILQLRTAAADVEYPVDFETLWPALGYSRKDNAKTKLEKVCTLQRDYKALLRAQDMPHIGGQIPEDIFLTFNAAQRFALQAGTSRSREIADFFIAALEVVQKYHLVWVYYGARQALQEGQRALEVERQARQSAEEKALALQVKLAGKHIPGQQLYVLQNPADGDRKLYKLGRTKDLSKRISNYATAIPDGATVLHVVSCVDSVASEKLAQRALEPYQYTGEWYQCDLSVITHVMDAAVLANDGIVRGATYLEKYDVVERMRAIFADIEAGEDLMDIEKASSKGASSAGNDKRERSVSPVQLVRRRITEGTGLLKDWLTGSTQRFSQPGTGIALSAAHEVESDSPAGESDETSTSTQPVRRWLSEFYVITGNSKDYVICDSIYKMYTAGWSSELDGPKLTKASLLNDIATVLRAGRLEVAGKKIDVVFGMKRNARQVEDRVTPPSDTIAARAAGNNLFAEWLVQHVLPNEHTSIPRADIWEAYKGPGTQAELYKALDSHCGGGMCHLSQHNRARGYGGYEYVA